MKTRCVIKVAGNVVLAQEASGTEVVNPRFHARIEEQIVCQERVGLVALHRPVLSLTEQRGSGGQKSTRSVLQDGWAAEVA